MFELIKETRRAIKQFDTLTKSEKKEVIIHALSKVLKNIFKFALKIIATAAKIILTIVLFILMLYFRFVWTLFKYGMMWALGVALMPFILVGTGIKQTVKKHTLLGKLKII